MTGSDRTTDFGFQRVAETEKAERVEHVFSSVAPRYDLMNDVLSGGLHRLWKTFTIRQAAVRPGMRVLDVASGTGDLARAFTREVGPEGVVVMTDINQRMLTAGRDRLLDEGRIVPAVRCCAFSNSAVLSRINWKPPASSGGATTELSTIASAIA